MVGMVVPEVQIVIIGVGPDFWVELCCLLRSLLIIPTMHAHITVFFQEDNAPEPILRQFLDLGVKFQKGVVERVLNLVLIGVHASDMIIVLNGHKSELDSTIGPDAPVLTLASCITKVLVHYNSPAFLLLELNTFNSLELVSY
jgi:hypothetical protein